jgi:hypothetical protein
LSAQATNYNATDIDVLAFDTIRGEAAYNRHTKKLDNLHTFLVTALQYFQI